MAEEEKSGEDRTEEPTARRLERAREEGQVALSKEAVMLSTLVAGLLGLMIGLPPMARELGSALRGVVGMSHSLTPEQALVALRTPVLLALLPVAVLTSLGAIIGTVLQTRGLVSAKSLEPKLTKLSPIAGLKRMFGVEGLIEFLRTIIKLAIVGLALWFALDNPASLQRLLHEPVAAMLGRSAELSFHLMKAALAAFAVLAVLDLVVTHIRHRRRHRMNREDMKEEQKEAEGDPHVKGRLRQLRLARARIRMMTAVPKAAVVITNPTHYAVALSYDRNSSAAPTLVAKGVDSLAAKIREVAQENRVPIVPNPPLARALHKLPLDAEIPPEHYQAVAEIIAYVWRLNNRASAPP